MAKINIHQAKTQLSRLIEEAAAGEEIIIARAGKPVARLISAGAAQKPRRKGLLKNKIHIAASFYKPLPETVIATFEGKIPK